MSVQTILPQTLYKMTKESYILKAMRLYDP